jgi:hypothetical protein
MVRQSSPSIWPTPARRASRRRGDRGAAAAAAVARLELADQRVPGSLVVVAVEVDHAAVLLLRVAGSVHLHAVGGRAARLVGFDEIGGDCVSVVTGNRCAARIIISASAGCTSTAAARCAAGVPGSSIGLSCIARHGCRDPRAARGAAIVVVTVATCENGCGNSQNAGVSPAEQASIVHRLSSIRAVLRLSDRTRPHSRVCL